MVLYSWQPLHLSLQAHIEAIHRLSDGAPARAREASGVDVMATSEENVRMLAEVTA